MDERKKKGTSLKITFCLNCLCGFHFTGREQGNLETLDIIKYWLCTYSEERRVVL